MKVVSDDMSTCPLTGFPSGPQSTTILRIIRNRKMVNCVAKTLIILHSYSLESFFAVIMKHACIHRLIELLVILLTITGRCSRRPHTIRSTGT